MAWPLNNKHTKPSHKAGFRRGFRVSRTHPKRMKNIIPTPRQLVRLCRMQEQIKHRNSSMLQAHIVRFNLPSAGDTPQFIYVASNLGKLIRFLFLGKNFKLSSTNETMNEWQKQNPTWRLVRLHWEVYQRVKHAADNKRLSAGLSVRLGYILKDYNPSRFFRRVLQSK